MIVVKCAWCGVVIGNEGDESTRVEEISHSICPVCVTKVQTEGTDLIIPFDNTDTDVQTEGIDLIIPFDDTDTDFESSA